MTIAITALEDASENDEECVAVVSRDTDVLVILIARLDDRRNIVLIQPQPGKADRTHDLYKISGELGALCEVLLALHAFTGCDTTSAPFTKGKKKLSSSARDSRCVRRSLHIFSQTTWLYRKPGRRYSCTCIRCSVIQVTRPRQILQTEADHCPKQDPVTSHLRVTTVTISGAARMHSFRVYLQVQLWYGRDMDPLKWGWEMKAGNLQPIGCERPAAPSVS